MELAHGAISHVSQIVHAGFTGIESVHGHVANPNEKLNTRSQFRRVIFPIGDQIQQGGLLLRRVGRLVPEEVAADRVPGLPRRAIPRPELFQLGVRLRGNTSKLKAGEYAIPSRASMDDIMEILIAGKAIQHKFTAAEGLTSDMIFKLLAADPVLIGDAGPEPAEGTLLPETYLFTHGATRSEILQRMKAAQKSLLDLRYESGYPVSQLANRECSTSVGNV